MKNPDLDIVFAAVDSPVGFGYNIREFKDIGIANIEYSDKTITIGGEKKSLVTKEATNRYGNVEPVRVEIRYGSIPANLELDTIYVDYLKTPQHVELT